MTDDMMTLRSMLEKGTDADLLREMIGFAAHRLMELEVQGAGTPIGGNDMFIAAQAVAIGCTLVTDSEAEFAHVDGLLWENWLRSG